MHQLFCRSHQKRFIMHLLCYLLSLEVISKLYTSEASPSSPFPGFEPSTSCLGWYDVYLTTRASGMVALSRS